MDIKFVYSARMFLCMSVYVSVPSDYAMAESMKKSRN